MPSAAELAVRITADATSANKALASVSRSMRSVQGATASSLTQFQSLDKASALVGVQRATRDISRQV
jgi:hypothetical protein